MGRGPLVLQLRRTGAVLGRRSIKVENLDLGLAKRHGGGGNLNRLRCGSEGVVGHSARKALLLADLRGFYTHAASGARRYSLSHIRAYATAHV